ncbi:hypothetical protein METH_14840 [Leisingera methylohalidivorans DSM 14336]|uniref:Uncharacterized protein n=1 Tax=Leisingera methylohalidivorans DSM 14336 TaxID=999552 RepID=V9VYY7_9RHOB|nr:hypothetical protein METH_14840 [Leisingera methylohalidivorans DSM 14336]
MPDAAIILRLDGRDNAFGDRSDRLPLFIQKHVDEPSHIGLGFIRVSRVTAALPISVEQPFVAVGSPLMESLPVGAPALDALAEFELLGLFRPSFADAGPAAFGDLANLGSHMSALHIDQVLASRDLWSDFGTALPLFTICLGGIS